MSQQSDIYKIAIKLLPHVGDIVAKRLISYCGSLEAVFKEKEKFLAKIPGIGTVVASSIAGNTKKKEIFNIAEKEVEFNLKFGIHTVFFLDENYPRRLIHCEDSPVTIFTLGNLELNHQKVLCVVGTRKATIYGKDFCRKLMSDFKEMHLDVQIISGLAVGIDIAAHKAAIENNFNTIAVLAHGLDTIYPAFHRKYAKQIIENGGLLTEFLTNTTPDKQNFIKRNRIIAGLADAALVVESGLKGGALITADIANSYNRDVYAVPGRISDSSSLGTNYLIKTNRAALAESAYDIANFLGWETKSRTAPVQSSFFTDFEPDELTIAQQLEMQGDLTIDVLSLLCKMPVSKISATLLGMEFKGIVKCLPGKVFQLCVSLPKS
ncbi:MAG: DNA-protecting protein DprA [Bacteroidetes bacterium CG23_combo_of_CG06-09_8_20_14_all_32_9]|nr:MAG: DNA-protecting protein DprA [Bacteroidetes bacterium CG23_combo_of_CG06-09_8_20_14_all_32_9]